MHIPDGFLDGPVALTCAVAAVGVLAVAVRRATATLDDRAVPLVGVTAAFVFAAQLLNVPVAAGTSGHFLGAALAAVLLGPWLACVVMAVVVGAQALLFADGGITALGANVLNMGVLGALAVGLAMVAARHVLPRRRAVLLGTVAVGAWCAVMLGALAATVEIALSGTVPLAPALAAMLGVHAVIGVGEAIVTVAALTAVLASRPDLVAVRDLTPAEAGTGAPAGA